MLIKIKERKTKNVKEEGCMVSVFDKWRKKRLLYFMYVDFYWRDNSNEISFGKGN